NLFFGGDFKTKNRKLNNPNKKRGGRSIV
ncbi:MAG: hypothetical protein A8274_1314, partial [Halanaerobium sp. 4-GBenrich]